MCRCSTVLSTTPHVWWACGYHKLPACKDLDVLVDCSLEPSLGCIPGISIICSLRILKLPNLLYFTLFRFILLHFWFRKDMTPQRSCVSHWTLHYWDYWCWESKVEVDLLSHLLLLSHRPLTLPLKNPSTLRILSLFFSLLTSSFSCLFDHYLATTLSLM